MVYKDSSFLYRVFFFLKKFFYKNYFNIFLDMINLKKKINLKFYLKKKRTKFKIFFFFLANRITKQNVFKIKFPRKNIGGKKARRKERNPTRLKFEFRKRDGAHRLRSVFNVASVFVFSFHTKTSPPPKLAV